MQKTNDLFSLEDKVAIITGASSGLGITFTNALADAGAKVILAARRKDLLDKLIKKLQAANKEAIAVTCDVTREDDVARLVDITLENYGCGDILVNNAGIANSVPAENETVDQFRQVIDVNVTGSFLCARQCGVTMLEAGKGSIINIASIMGLVGIGQIPQLAYNASKGAVINMTRELAAQWARRGVRVNALAPGWFPSEMTSDLFENKEAVRFVSRKTPMGRTGNPSELVGPLLLLASDASSFMTGQTIVVDGGWTIV
ncbi:MAG: glucose 1-dehydrogenase [Desulfobacterales bacterium]|nr:glucose 1-dehydrogenase [Desulfobacterales bacterium]